MYIVSSPEDILAVYKLPKALDTNPFIRELLHAYGSNNDTLDKMYGDSFQGGKHYTDATRDNFKQQLHPGEKLDRLQDILLSFIDRVLTWENLTGDEVLRRSVLGEEKTVSLYQWAQRVLFHAANKAFFGESLYEVTPDLFSQYYTFKDED